MKRMARPWDIVLLLATATFAARSALGVGLGISHRFARATYGLVPNRPFSHGQGMLRVEAPIVKC